MKSTFTRRMKALLALGVTGAALVAAGPASAVDNAPVDGNGKKSCAYAKWGGGTGHYPHGTTITVTLPEGGSATVKCTDGEWVKTRTATSQPPRGYITYSGMLKVYGSMTTSGYMARQ